MSNSPRPSWDQYFFNIAREVAMRATCLRRKYGAVIVKNNVMVSSGYNGAPKGNPNCCDAEKCQRMAMGCKQGERYDLCCAVHAETNALINGNPADLNGATLYLSGIEVATGESIIAVPCDMCMRMLANAGVQFFKPCVTDGEEEDEEVTQKTAVNVFPNKTADGTAWPKNIENVHIDMLDD